MRIRLKAGEKLFLNGAVVEAEQKVTLKLLNDAVFLLEPHVLQKEEATTPLKQLYFAGQMVLIEPQRSAEAFKIFLSMLDNSLRLFKDEQIVRGLRECGHLVKDHRIYDVLKIIRSLYPREALLLESGEEPFLKT